MPIQGSFGAFGRTFVQGDGVKQATATATGTILDGSWGGFVDVGFEGASGYVGEGADEGGRAIEAFGSPELEAEVGGGLAEGDVDVVEDLDVVAEKADRLHDHADVTFGLEGFEGVFDGGADPGGTGDALALEGEDPVGVAHADGSEAAGDGGCGALALDGVGVGGDLCVVGLDAFGWDGGVGASRGVGDPGEYRSAGDAVGGKEDGDAAAREGAGLGPDGPEAFGEGEGEERAVGPAGDELGCEGGDTGRTGGGFEEDAAVEADAGTGVLGGEADGLDVGDAVGTHLGYDVGDVGVPVAHADVDGEVERFAEELALEEGPAGEGRRLGARGFGEADLGVAVLEFFDDGWGERAAVGDVGEVLGHLAEGVGGAVGEEEDGGFAAGGSAGGGRLGWGCGLGVRRGHVVSSLDELEGGEGWSGATGVRVWDVWNLRHRFEAGCVEGWCRRSTTSQRRDLATLLLVLVVAKRSDHVPTIVSESIAVPAFVHAVSKQAFVNDNAKLPKLRCALSNSLLFVWKHT
jgi:hypothetical protein